jgi:hypothetical protein
MRKKRNAASASADAGVRNRDCGLTMLPATGYRVLATGYLPRALGIEGGAMNRIEKKELAPGAARLFEAEVLALKPEIPRSELCDMVDDYIYYQTDDLSRVEAHALVDGSCRMASLE